MVSSSSASLGGAGTVSMVSSTAAGGRRTRLASRRHTATPDAPAGLARPGTGRRPQVGRLDGHGLVPWPCVGARCTARAWGRRRGAGPDRRRCWHGPRQAPGSTKPAAHVLGIAGGWRGWATFGRAAKVPRPCMRTRRPSMVSSRKAWRIVVRLVEKLSASVRSGGRAWPGPRRASVSARWPLTT